MVKRNIIANYLGQGWRAIMSLAFIPLYIKYLGIEAYGLIGIFAVLQSWSSLLDMGMKPAIGREMARFTGGAHNAQSIRDLLRSIEFIAIAIAISVGFGIWAVSGWLASNWVQAKNIPVGVVAQTFALMGLVTSLQFIESIYTSSMAGLQRQALQNVVISIMATLRGLGAIVVLAWISPTIQAFFLWQGLISIATLVIVVVAIYRILPPTARRACFSWPALLGIWRFAAGMAGITLLSLLLMQVDKLLLSRLLTLEVFGYYALASVVAGSLYLLTTPIAAAFFPRFTELVTRQDDAAMRHTFHQGAQLVTVLMGSATAVLMVFGERILMLWTSDIVLTRQVSPIMTVLALGTLLNGLMWMPYQVQLAYSWTSLTIRINTIAVILLVPAILWLVPIYGALSAAWIWVALNSAYVLIGVHFMYRRMLTTEKWAWYRSDLFIPIATAGIAALLCRWILPGQMGRLGELLIVACSSVVVLGLTGMAAPLVRLQVMLHLPQRLRNIQISEG